jgi:cation diffusion facilitator family transporter
MQASRKVVYAGLASNLLIAIAKFVVAAITGSSAMLAEGFHSAADTGNTLLLLYGMHRSQRPAHEIHPFGHGLELYFWSFVVAVSMFAVGGVLSIWEGVQHIVHPMAVAHESWSYIVLGISIVLSAGSFVVAMREANSRRGETGILDYIRRSKDPTVFTMILEDSSDIFGALVAALAIFLATVFHDSRIDGVGSIAVGLSILSVSVVLANECRGLMVGETAPRKDVARMKQLLAMDPSVAHVGDLLTMQLGPDVILLNVEIQFKPHRAVEDLESTVDRLESSIRKEFPAVQHLFIEAKSLRRPEEKLRRAS